MTVSIRDPRTVRSSNKYFFQGVSESQISKKLNDLEGRLYRANSKFNERLCENDKLREEIDTLRLVFICITRIQFFESDRSPGFVKSHHTICSFAGCGFKHIQKNCYEDLNKKVAILQKMTMCRGEYVKITFKPPAESVSSAILI